MKNENLNEMVIRMT